MNALPSFASLRGLLAGAALAAACAGQALAQGLPPLPKAVGPATARGKPAMAPPAATSAPAPEPPLLPPAPRDLAKPDQPCAELDPKAQEWLLGAFAALQAQMLRPNGLPKAREAFAEVWLGFKTWRDRGFDADPYGARVEAVYKALYPAGPFAPETPFERFREPRYVCRKAKALAGQKAP